MVWMAAMAQGGTQDFQEKTVIWVQGVLMYVKGIPTVHVHFPSKLTALKMALRLWHSLLHREFPGILTQVNGSETHYLNRLSLNVK